MNIQQLARQDLDKVNFMLKDALFSAQDWFEEYEKAKKSNAKDTDEMLKFWNEAEKKVSLIADYRKQVIDAKEIVTIRNRMKTLRRIKKGVGDKF